jgi:hypothetical protein
MKWWTDMELVEFMIQGKLTRPRGCCVAFYLSPNVVNVVHTQRVPVLIKIYEYHQTKHHTTCAILIIYGERKNIGAWNNI